MLETVAKLEVLTKEFFELMNDGSKTAHSKARKVSNEITKTLPLYRKECVAFDAAKTKKREPKVAA